MTVAKRGIGLLPKVMPPCPPLLIRPRRFGDARGWFTETYSVSAMAAIGIAETFVQDNHSLSLLAFTLRGLHFQTPPHAQAKLVRCVRGRVFDVIVDARAGSPTYGEHVAAELSAENGHQIYVPVGYAHGFLTLEAKCEVVYKCSSAYAADHDGGIRWNSGGIDWPLPTGVSPELSAKDCTLPLIDEFDSPFAYDGVPLQSLS